MRPIILALSLVLGIIPLFGIVWIFATGMLQLWPPSATVDGLFMTLILLTLSGCLLLNVLFELRDRKGKKTAPAAKAPVAKTT